MTFTQLRSNLLTAVFLTCISCSAFGQQEGNFDKPWFGGLGVSWLSYSGDLNEDLDGFFFSAAKPEVHIFGEKKLHDWFGAKAELSWGQLTWQSRATYNFRNFNTNMYGGGLQGILYLANDAILPIDGDVRPYLGAGISYYLLDVKSDLLDANGLTYHYWSDGSIRHLPETEANELVATEIERDYESETKLEDIDKGALIVPVELGFHYRMNDMLDATLSYRYAFGMSDYLDGISNGGNDSYHQVGLTLRVNITKYTAPPEAFVEVDKDDADGDGVTDFMDECADTPNGVDVNMRGCPKDSDKDGVPDYIDEEPNSKSGNVDEYGIEVTDERLQETQLPINEEDNPVKGPDNEDNR